MRKLHLIAPSYSPIGIDIGSRSINIVQLKRSRGKTSLYKIVSVPHKYDIGSMENRQYLSRVFKENRFKGKKAVSRIAPDYVTILPVKLKLPKGKSVEEAIIREAQSNLSFPVEKAVIDYIDLSMEGITHIDDEGNKEYRALLVMSHIDDVERHINLIESLQLELVAIDIGPNALKRAIEFNNTADTKQLLLINIGDQFSFFTVIWNGKILIDRKVKWGEEKILEKLRQNLELKDEELRKLLGGSGIFSDHKINAHSLAEKIPEEDIAPRIYNIISGELEELAGEIEKVLVYCASELRGAVVNKAFLLGSGALIHHFDSFLHWRLGIEVQYFNPFHCIDTCGVDLFQEESMASIYGVSIGLALRGFNE